MPLIPVWIFKVTSYQVLLLAPSPSQAISWARLATDDGPISADPTTPPFISRADRATVNEVWRATAFPPTDWLAAMQTPTPEQWQQALSTSVPDVRWWMHLGHDFNARLNVLNYDHPKFTSSWNLHHVYIHSFAPFVWYQEAATKSEAEKLVRQFWVEQGIYMPPRAIQYEEIRPHLGLTEPWKPLGLELPKLPWDALFKLNCLPLGEEVVGFGKNYVAFPKRFHRVQFEPYNVRPPYDMRDHSSLQWL